MFKDLSPESSNIQNQIVSLSSEQFGPVMKKNLKDNWIQN